MLKASRRSEVEPFIVMDVMRAAADLEAAGRDVVHLEVGQPGAPAPRAVLAAANEALVRGRLGYTEALGMRPLRERIAKHYREHYGVALDAARVMVTTGSSAGFNLSFLAAFDPGDRVAIASPGYPAYRNIMRALGIVPVEIAVEADTRWALTAEHVEAAHRQERIDGVLVASPGNPSGTTISADELKHLVETCERLGIRFISDEIYHGLVYAGREETALHFGTSPIVVNSFSKYYCMTGWRIGWLVLPEDLIRPCERLSQSLYISVPEISQRAAMAAFDATEELEEVKAGYARNRARLLQALPGLGFDEILPVDGAFYVYASVARLTNDSVEFTARMLAEASVATTPGVDFDSERGKSYIRFSFAGSEEDIVEGIARMERWLA